MFEFNINGFDMDIYEATLEIYIEDQLIQSQQMQAPKKMLQLNFVQLVNQAKDDNRPIKVRMVVPQIIWDNYEKKQKVLNNEISFSNNAMDYWKKNK